MQRFSYISDPACKGTHWLTDISWLEKSKLKEDSRWNCCCKWFRQCSDVRRKGKEGRQPSIMPTLPYSVRPGNTVLWRSMPWRPHMAQPSLNSLKTPCLHIQTNDLISISPRTQKIMSLVAKLKQFLHCHLLVRWHHHLKQEGLREGMRQNLLTANRMFQNRYRMAKGSSRGTTKMKKW